MEEYNRRTNNARLTGHQEAPYGYDSAWTVAFMLNRSIEMMKKSSEYSEYSWIYI